MSQTERRTWFSKQIDTLVQGAAGGNQNWTHREKRCRSRNCYGCHKGVWRRQDNTASRRTGKRDIRNQLTGAS